MRGCTQKHFYKPAVATPSFYIEVDEYSYQELTSLITNLVKDGFDAIGFLEGLKDRTKFILFESGKFSAEGEIYSNNYSYFVSEHETLKDSIEFIRREDLLVNL